ncbi:uncharacterized protein PV09_08771 [Verruconis gallopava]|uniref:Uncharacterized protein n=1 Tax=Verruconis gallopava TaxID=253628 RepID=A0A0D1XBM3_9PEZI|nr:uncharacterized protein PV09_08771 [Verruconis gallopava]KIV99595.1 hypothetical protein PV09_08771 [Verruconis gallopava]
MSDTNYNLIVLYVILGACAAVMCSYAVARLTGNFEEAEFQNFSNEQVEYMRQVRQRNLDYLGWMMRSKRPSSEGRLPVGHQCRCLTIITSVRRLRLDVVSEKRRGDVDETGDQRDGERQG